MNLKKSIPLFFVFILAISCQKSTRDLYPESLTGSMQLLSSDQTGIDFNNSIEETPYENFFFYSQIYNGGGVAIGDINNDGLSDVFFSGNQVSDRLYLNKGDFKFEDITDSSGAATNSGWSWGVTMVDVNNDGYLDIYVSRNGESMNPDDRRNQLYINNQDLTFTESAIAYGLADKGFSSQAVFFDMDNDGDLDMYQVNQLPGPKLFIKHNITRDTYKYYSDKLYKNENGKYIDVSKQAGLVNKFTHGLNVSASDFNNDGWIDLYVTNDYDEPDIMYYNNQDGTFKNVIDSTLKHISRFSMGSDAGDINNDGFTDLLTLDMAAEDHYRSKTNMGSMSTEYFNKIVSMGNHYQYMTNTLQVNSGTGVFSDIAEMTGFAKTDWSWGALIVDLDNDGWKDGIVTNGIKKDVRNNDFLKIASNLDPNISADKFFEFSKEAPSVPLSNYLYQNKKNLKFQKVSKEWGFDKEAYSSGIAYGDLDNDGDLDLVTNNMDLEAFVYENKATGNFIKIEPKGSNKNKFGIGVKAKIYYEDQIQINENITTRGYFSSVEPGLFFGLGMTTVIDKIEVRWPDGKTNILENVKANQTIQVDYAKAKTSIQKPDKLNTLLNKFNQDEIGLNFQHQENNFDEFKTEILLPHNLSQNGPFSAIDDVNGDGLDDIFIGGASGQSAILYTQNESGKFIKGESQPWESDFLSEDLGCLFIDIDNDGDSDLYVASGGSEFKRGSSQLTDRLYINNGFGDFMKSRNKLPYINESSQCVKSVDIDNDGDLDVFVGVRLIEGKYTFPASSYFLINTNGSFTKSDSNSYSALNNIGMVTDAVFSDIDSDGDKDILVVGEWMNITLLLNNDGVFENATKEYGLDKTRGIWWTIKAEDLDNDGDDDYIIGNLGVNNKFKATKEHPFKVYANDFDDNGSNDIVLAKYYKDDYVPVRGRECTSQQMPFVSEKFEDFHSFASSNLLDILPENKMDDAVVYEISSFESIILINDNGKLIKKALPVESQISPIKSILIKDINNDGHKDIITVGNHYGVEVETTRYDAGIGAVLLGDGANNFKSIGPHNSGLTLTNDSRQINTLKINNEYMILITNNNEKLELYQLNSF